MGSSKEDYATDADNSAGDHRRLDSNCKVFSDGEKVLAYHGPRIYEAKACSKIRDAEERVEIFRSLPCKLETCLQLIVPLHEYWDEWVGVERLMKYTQENIQKQQDLGKKQGVDRNPKSGRSNQTKPKISTGAKGKKRKNDSSTEKEIASIEKLVNIEIPSTLKKQLVDDWEFVNEQDKLVKLPRSPNVDDILDSYLEYRSKKDGILYHLLLGLRKFHGCICHANTTDKSTSRGATLMPEYRMTDSIGEILKGLRCYFDRALPVILLYDKERQQYRESVADDASPSSIYGAEHLLRLFVKLPELLPYLNIEEDLVMRLQQKFLDFLRFLQKKQTSFFISSYDDDSKVSEASSVVRPKTSRD
ncbi:Chromo domain-like protein [Cynara cardunculus var. scolymus]|uniref:Chromo domain-like protein n=1 Tax=Cynara cardunculus var. scolymus TaxID=59895 RepID=A0A103YH35_CYNCS|nr:Chromo domain-like protein [Cynara cardunculus var. scolymus]